MSKLAITAHAKVRAAQRAIPLSDPDLLMLVGSEVDDGYFVRDRDLEEFEQMMREILRRVRRWRGTRLVVANGCVVTTYRPDRREERKLLRHAEECGL